MRSNGRYAALALVALAALLWGIAQYRGRSGTGPAAPTVVLVAPTRPADASFKMETSAHKAAAGEGIESMVLSREDRGAGLRDKGEALGGGADARVEMSTVTAR